MTVSVRSGFRLCWAGLALSLFGCLGPATSDRTGYSPYLLANGAVIPSIENDKRLAQQIDTNDALDAPMVMLRSAYTGGHEVRYWDFGAASATAFPPMWLFRRVGSDNQLEEFGHPNLIDSIPGETTYSPIRAVYIVAVTNTYAGEQITSLQALDDAMELGLVKKPTATGMYANCPVTLSTMLLDLGDGSAPLSPTTAYYKGKTTSYFALNGAETGIADFALDKTGKIPAPNAYLPRRQNELRVLDEFVWRADLNADGDMTDTNVIFEVDPENAKYLGIWKQVTVTVPPDYVFGTSQAESDLFKRMGTAIAPIDGAVVDYQDPGTLLNRPIRSGAP